VSANPAPQRGSPRALPPELPAPPEVHIPPPQHFTLASGLDVFVVERRELPVIDMQVVVRAGAAATDPATAGRAFFTAALLDQGTTTRSATAIADEAELLGATLQTRATWDACTAALHVLTQRLDPALDLLADVMLRPTFPADELERARQRRLAAILQEADEPRVVASQLFARAAFGDRHPYGAPVGGTAATVATLRGDDVRAFHQQWFAPHNAFIVAVGDVDALSLRARLDDRFGGWTGTRAGPLPVTPLPPPPVRSIGIRHRPGAPQSELRVGLPGPPRRTPDYFPLLVANTVLGGSFTSRLNILLRQEKGYTYGAGSSFAFRRDGGPFLASTAVSTAATADALNDMVREIGRMSAEPVPEPELERARNYIMLGLPRTFETTGDIAEHVSDVALFDLGVDWYEHYAEHVRAVDADAVRDACRRWLRADELTIIVVGDADVVAVDLEKLGLGAVNVRTED
jgi:zinc protease